jgi:Ca2+-transporting ATPase
MIWYKETIEKLYKILGSSEQGITTNESVERSKRYGLNRLTVQQSSLWATILEPFKSIFIVVLLVAAVVSILSQTPIDAAVIIIIILINAIIFYVQKYATTRVLRSLKKKSVQRVSVIRDDVKTSILSLELVPGDIIVLLEGERVPADARLVHVENLEIDESLMTGESIPVRKHVSTLNVTKQIFEQGNMVFAGTYVIAGMAKALVVETGSRTEYGKIAELATEDVSKSPVQVKIDGLVKLLIRIVGILAIIVLVLSLMRGISPSDALRFALSLSVSAVPEGLPVALTVIIVLGMRRMAKKKALVRSFKSIEDIGLVTTIVTDKTGTLTLNHLTVAESWSLGREDVNKSAAHTVNSDDGSKDSIDLVIREHLRKYSNLTINKAYPFDINVRMSGMYVRSDQRIYLKGSPEHMLSKSSATKEQRNAVESAMHSFASKGHRVIAIGQYKVTGNPPADLTEIGQKKIIFIGLLALADEVRPEAARAIRLAKDAGISIKMITGDHYETAYNIGKQLGLANHPDQVIQGADLPKDEESLRRAIEGKTVFARFLPEDKFRVLKALKLSEITAMTGDGVNDVPAIANAHVGIAMGSGSDIAKDAGGIVLLDDNFSTIIRAIAEGRRLFNNIRKMLFYLLSTSIGEVATMVGALIVGLPLPVTALQILWINLVTDTAMVLPLGLEPEEPRSMKRPPRRSSDPLLSRVLVTRTVLVACTMAIGILGIIFVLSRQGYSTYYIQTVSFLALITAQWTNAFNAKNERLSLFSRANLLNRGLVFGLLIGVFLQSIVMFGPLASLFGIQSVSIVHLVLSSGLMVILILAVVEVHKLVTRTS